MKFKKILPILFLCFFFLSRVYILKNPPANYSDVKQDYERYANAWWYGLEPYKELIFEYPPAAVPLLILPLLLDQLGVGSFYPNYRLQIFIFDCFLALFIFKLINKLKISAVSKYLSLFYFCLLPVIAKDFFYEGIDLFYSGLLTIALISLVLYDQNKLRHRISFWAIYWWSFAIKFMSFPLFPLFILTKKLKLKKELIAFIIGFSLIWLYPLAHYRSSVSVSYVYHQNRQLKYSSLGDHLIRGINLFTNSEKRIQEPPDFNYIGPVSTIMNRLFSKVFPLSILIIVAYNMIILTKGKKLKGLVKYYLSIILDKQKINSSIDTYKFSVRTTILFSLTLMLTGITVSQPFAIWLIPLLTVFPYKNIEQQLRVFVLATIFIIQMTSYLHNILIPFPDNQILISLFDWNYGKQTLRFIVLLLLFITTFKLSYEKK